MVNAAVMRIEPRTIVSSGSANKAAAILLTRKMSSPSKLSTVPYRNLAMKVAILKYCNAVQDAGGETTVKLKIVKTASTKKLMTVNLAEYGTLR
jgi:hypothetical protein